MRILDFNLPDVSESSSALLPSPGSLTRRLFDTSRAIQLYHLASTLAAATWGPSLQARVCRSAFVSLKMSEIVSKMFVYR